MVEMYVKTMNTTDILTSSVPSRRTEEACPSEPYVSDGDDNLVGWFGESLAEFSEDDEDIVPLVDDDDTPLVDESDVFEASSEGQGVDVEDDACMAKQKAMTLLYGEWEQSYNELPRLRQTMEFFIPGTIVRYYTHPAVTLEEDIIPRKRIFGGLFWAFKFKKKNIKKDIINMVYALLQPNFCARLENLRRYGDDVCEFTAKIPGERWSQVYDVEGRRYGHMTTNLAECINSVLKGTQYLPIAGIVRETYFRLGKVWEYKSAQIDVMINDGRNWAPDLEKAMQKNQTHATSMFVHNFARLDSNFVVHALV
ncbi:hypothetical protein F3Y22_tig00002237pilonHSYRG01481 [Hibiscus syriacus]|uniref:Uncharacterized protein n=1 Tax=Hibiscus syriacus TaxID=106335 RepID=A0A6A3CYX4_HIBSY|nr:hypothetical protein F3Y22_tig00002237pilonHSYRG01481 [Hibiscus syriacus]